MRKTCKGLKEGLLVLMLAVAVVAGPGCAGTDTPEQVTEPVAPTEENTEYYITMKIGEDFVTATVDLATYEGETLVFEKGWFKVPVEEELQQSANEVSRRAYEAVRSLLEKETEMTMGEVVR